MIMEDTSCLPKCSGLQISSFDKESIEKNKELMQNMDIAFSMQLEILKELRENLMKYSLPASLTAWSKFHLEKENIILMKIIFTVSRVFQKY